MVYGNIFDKLILLYGVIMTKAEWQAHNGFTDSEMDLISRCLEVFNGTIVSIKDIK